MNQTRIIILLAVFGSIFSINSAFAIASDRLCTQESYVVGFFNGVWNTERETRIATAFLKKRIEAQTLYNLGISTDQVQYEYFYNMTGKATGASQFQDLAEVFMQRAEAISPNYAKRFELFWSSVSGDADEFLKSFTHNATQKMVVGLVTDLYTDMTTTIAGTLGDIFSNPPTDGDYANHRTRLQTLALEGKNLVLIAHSQGNLFMNRAFKGALDIEQYTRDQIGAVHIAPASAETQGPHILADIDSVINGLRVFGIRTVPANTVSLPLSHLQDDPSGHTLLGTYLNTALVSHDQTLEHIESEFARLLPPQQTLAEQGAFNVTLTWDGEGDVDLHTYEPSSAHVHYARPAGLVGYLDVDNVTGFGPEHYYASCNPQQLESGSYFIGINNYSADSGRRATIQISTPHVAELVSKTIELDEAKGNAGNIRPQILLKVDIQKNGLDTRISAQEVVGG